MKYNLLLETKVYIQNPRCGTFITIVILQVHFLILSLPNLTNIKDTALFLVMCPHMRISRTLLHYIGIYQLQISFLIAR